MMITSMITLVRYWKKLWGIARPLTLLLFFILPGQLTLQAQVQRQIRGKIVDGNQTPIGGASIKVKGTSVATASDDAGMFTLLLPADKHLLTVSKIGYGQVEVDVANKTTVDIQLTDKSIEIEETIVVGYGRQKKETVVGAIAQTSGRILERSGGVSSVGAALTGNVPGVITTASTGMPGEEDPRIVIRGRSTWNNTDPLVMVDGVERPLSAVDISSIETVSVLKDASATAVYGVRGANGVILITTKRGKEGQMQIRGTVNNVIKTVSQLPGKMDSYDALMLRNKVIEYELGISPSSWANYLPQDIINKYRYPADQTERERYVNTDWGKELFRSHAFSQNSSVNIAGGTPFVKYFANADYLYEGDMFRQFENARGYKAGYGFNRLNVRSNLDFQLTPTTKFSTNLAGSRGVRKSPWGGGNDYSYWIAAYTVAPDVIYPRYSDGTWGYYALNTQAGINSARVLAISGTEYITTSRITTDFTLEQDLKFLAKGLDVRATISLDNTFVEGGRGINDANNNTQSKWIDPNTGLPTYQTAFDGTNRFDFVEGINWTTGAGQVRDGATYRRLFYQLQLNYATTIAQNHNITAMGLVNRNQYGTGSSIPSYREDWVFRTTYNYKNKYMLDYSGAYTGSEKFAPENRFAFFNSGGIGWLVTGEEFMKPLSFLNMLKLRASYGDIGDDSGGGRFLYLTQWAYGGTAGLGVDGRFSYSDGNTSPYTWYKESAIGNPDIHWEKVNKLNFGVDFGLFNDQISGKVDFFRDHRTNVLITGSGRSVPSYFGVSAPTVNDGEVINKGYEVELKFNKQLNRDLRIWADVNITHAKDRVIFADAAELLPEYQKPDNKQVNQTYSYVGSGYYNTWDELYSSTPHESNDLAKLPGNYHILDYNADGIIDTKDNIPYAFPSVPQNTYNCTLGFDWKNFSVMTQWYAVNNVTRQVVFNSFSGQLNLAYDEGSYWSKDNVNADVPLPRWLSQASSYTPGNRYMFDGSYIRLKTAEIAYTFNHTSSLVKRLGLQHLRVFLNGNNLLFWSKMPDDRESNYAGTGWASQGAYPTVKRFNLGANITF
ncbi:SusC/RagA family TonB-linked outer membrane protein [Sphingobacterium thalpophilum]|uniref:SusC/RagA family TonB-linked outer membrane protein n=1 Tax=Sphingobacterium thalpophilum TaxID=259 RepID=UPI002D76A91D|nr:SusC/RagA family TonB-linked outer membrane protein [Sphingobacterium thalpophilum]